jgi:hypothetical protein
LIEPFILPHQTEFSSTEAFRLASGPASWNQQQGFYFYRAGRMIQSGGWSNLRTPDEHTKLARIAVRFAPALDDAFKINVAKMRVQMPAAIRDSVRDAMVPIVKLARETYDRKERRGTPTSTPIVSATSSVVAREVANVAPPVNPPAQPSFAINSGVLMTVEQWRHRTLAVASAAERPTVEAVLSRLNDGERVGTRR